MSNISLSLLLLIGFNVTLANHVEWRKASCFMPSDSMVNPLEKFSGKWKDTKFQACNTAKNVDYLTAEEKKLIWVLNLIRFDPKLFLNTVLLDAEVVRKNKGSYYNSLIRDMKKLKPNPILLVPDYNTYVSAYCHAVQAGERGYIGHERFDSGCKFDCYGECCDYGNRNAVDILINLLVDEGIESLGHRKICLSDSYSLIGVSIQPHKTYRVNAVLDFK